MDKDILILRAVNEAIWLRDHASKIDKEKLFEVIENIGEYNVFSARQLSALAGNSISHQTVARLCKKTEKTGGRLNPKSLDEIKQCFHDRINGTIDYQLISKILDAGTSQGMVEKLTGISQTKISKGINGSVLKEGKLQ
jgi:hypothetical protein